MMRQENLPEITQLLDLWDQGTKLNRADILKLFIAECKGKTAPELEGIFSRAASLFLTRLTAWLRLTYPFTELNSFLMNSKAMLEDRYVILQNLFGVKCHKRQWKTIALLSSNNDVE